MRKFLDKDAETRFPMATRFTAKIPKLAKSALEMELVMEVEAEIIGVNPLNLSNPRSISYFLNLSNSNCFELIMFID